MSAWRRICCVILLHDMNEIKIKKTCEHRRLLLWITWWWSGDRLGSCFMDPESKMQYDMQTHVKPFKGQKRLMGFCAVINSSRLTSMWFFQEGRNDMDVACPLLLLSPLPLISARVFLPYTRPILLINSTSHFSLPFCWHLLCASSSHPLLPFTISSCHPLSSYSLVKIWFF